MATNNELNLGNTSLIVNQGGSGIASSVVYTPICGGTTTTSPLQSVVSLGNSGDILASQGNALPVFLPGLGSSPIIYTKVTISSSEIKGMFATPKLLVAAGGANTMLYPMATIFEIKYNSATYAGGGNVFIQWDSTASGGGTKALGSITAANAGVTSTADAFSYLVTLGSVAITTTSAVVNKGFYLSNSSGAFTTGNSTCYVHLYYTVLLTAV
jgi:hypothetical protein